MRCGDFCDCAFCRYLWSLITYRHVAAKSMTKLPSAQYIFSMLLINCLELISPNIMDANSVGYTVGLSLSYPAGCRMTSGQDSLPIAPSPSKQYTLTQFCFNVGPASDMTVQHQTYIIGSCWLGAETKISRLPNTRHSPCVGLTKILQVLFCMNHGDQRVSSIWNRHYPLS